MMGGGGPPRGAPGGGRGAGNAMRPMGRGDYGEINVKFYPSNSTNLWHGKAWLCDQIT